MGRASPFLGCWAKNVAGAEGASEIWRFFHLENEVYLAKIAFESENFENCSPPAGYFCTAYFILYHRSNTYMYSLYVNKNRPCISNEIVIEFHIG